MKRPYSELMENANCVQYALAEKIYQLGREDAMNDDGVPKQLLEMGYKKGREDAIDEFWTEFDKQIKTIGRQAYYYTDFLVIGMKIREQMKEQNK